MSSNTTNLALLKMDPTVDGNSTFNIKTMLNDNWDKIDAGVLANLLSAKGYTDTKIAALLNSSPATLDTLKELADALGDDPNFAATMATLIGTKETPAGAQAKVDVHAGNNTMHIPYASDTGIVNAYVATIPSTVALVAGLAVAIKINTTNTGASTLNVNGLGAKPLLLPNSSNFTSGALSSGITYTFRYNGFNWHIQGIGAKIDASMVFAADGTTTFESHLADNVKHPAYVVTTGSANTYIATLSPAPTSYIDGMGIVTKINVASTGASTINVNTLGAIPIKDSLGNAITSGGLKANTPYTLRYESVSGSFIVQGKGGGGNLIASQLRLGVTATGDSGPVVGTEVNNTGIAKVYTVNTADQAVMAGYTDGAVGSIKVKGEAALLAANIVAPNVIGNVTGTAIPIDFVSGTNIIASSLSYNSSTPTSMVKVKEFLMGVRAGVVRVSYDLGWTNLYTVVGQIYKNGVAFGILRTLSCTGSYVTYTEDISFNVGDLIQLYIHTLNTSTAMYGGNMKLMVLNSPTVVTVNV